MKRSAVLATERRVEPDAVHLIYREAVGKAKEKASVSWKAWRPERLERRRGTLQRALANFHVGGDTHEHGQIGSTDEIRLRVRRIRSKMPKGL